MVIKIINSSSKTESIDWLFKTLKDTVVQNFNYDKINFENRSEQSSDIIIFNIDEINLSLIELIKSFLNIYNTDYLFFSFHHSLSTEISQITRLGVHKIYFYPEEEFLLRNDVAEFIQKLRADFEANSVRNRLYKKFSFDNLIGRSPNFTECIEIAKRVSKKGDATVLLLGETGTGKELLAKAIHYNSPRANEPFIELNTSAISENLFESELFGYEKGAFTDAKVSKPGLLEIAENGTAFLDEIGDLSFNLQVKLLRAIENKVIKRLGGIKDIQINCRIIAATNQNLEKLVDEKKFRADLYYRLKVVSIHLPPLRERVEDIIPLAEHFIDLFNKKYDSKIEGITQKAKRMLLQYSWPGNIRELSNVIERAILLSNSNYISEKDIQLGQSSILTTMKKNIIEIKVEIDNAKIEKVTYELAKEVLKLVDGNKTQAAKILGISRPSLIKILNERNTKYL